MTRMNGCHHVLQIRQHGFTLIELMVGSLIGLFLIGGIGTVFISNQQMAGEKSQLDDAQETFRYGSHTITRMVRMTNSIGPSGSTATQLVVTFNEGAGVRDCRGNLKTVTGGPPLKNTFLLSGGSLQCCLDAPPCNSSTTSKTPVSLATGIGSLAFTYGVDSDNDGWVSDAEHVAYGSVGDWSLVRSVRTSMKMASSGLESIFVASLRPVVLAQQSPSSAPGGSTTGGSTPVVEPPVVEPPVVEPPVVEPPDTGGSIVDCNCTRNGDNDKNANAVDQSNKTCKTCCNEATITCTGKNCLFTAKNCPVLP